MQGQQQYGMQGQYGDQYGMQGQGQQGFQPH